MACEVPGFAGGLFGSNLSLSPLLSRHMGETTVWVPLSSPTLVTYFEDGEGGDWSPMRRVVGTLFARDYASVLFAITALYLFTITFSQAFGQPSGAGTVSLTFDSPKRLFTVRFDGLGKQDRAVFLCEEFEVARLVDALVLRMQMTRLRPPENAS
jgi:hypothetical protein